MIGSCLRSALSTTPRQQAVEADEEFFRPAQVELLRSELDGAQYRVGDTSRGSSMADLQAAFMATTCALFMRGAGGARGEVAAP